MKKIPTLFERVYENHKVVEITDKVTPGFEWVLNGKGVATVKFDGSCCAIIDGELYKRYDAKKGKKPPIGAIPCCDPDPVTKHWPHWVKVNPDGPEDKWFVEAYYSYIDNFGISPKDGTYEAIGPKFQSNPYNLTRCELVEHGISLFTKEDNIVWTFESIRDYLKDHSIEGIVFWKDGEPQCKIKRSDFGFEWPVKK